MSYLRLPPSLGKEHDPTRIAHQVFGTPDWRSGRPAEHVVDVGGNWQALHYLITGDPWDGRAPEADVVCGGRLLTEDGAERLGMDVIFLGPDRVKLVADHLAATPFKKISGRFDRAAMAAAEVQDAKKMNAQTRDKVLRPAYEALGRFYAAAAGEGEAVYKAMA